MKLKQLFLELLDRGDYIPVEIRKKAVNYDLLNKQIDSNILKKIGLTDYSKYLSYEFWMIPGIGFDKAIELYNKGTKIQSLKPGTKQFEELPISTQSYLIYKPIIKIPNNMILGIVNQFIPLKYTSGINYDIVGSYLRGSPFSSDIDILWYEFKVPFGATKFNWHIYAKGPNKISGIYTTKDGSSVKIDIWLVSKKEYVGPMKLYTTGSKMFNIRQRMQAKKLGYKLNQEGLFDIKTNNRIKADTEKEIFKLLNMEYLEPKDRK